jgi:mRNA-degrading endonuclease RelE of RelBE toxin-antitoxin system
MYMSRRPVSVIELAGYRRRADELLTREEQQAVVDLVAYEPDCGDIIPGTGGLRKVRIGRGGMGKRGGARVVYYFHDEDVPIFLLAIYAKNEKSDLTATEKREFAKLVKETVTQWKRK